MSRSEAKDAVRNIISMKRIISIDYLRGNQDVEYMLHEMLEIRFGYKHQGTRRCIISEAFRDAGKPSLRDTFVGKTYRFEDHTLIPFLGEKVTRILPEDTLVTTLTTLCNALGIVTPSLTFKSTGKGSTAIRGHHIILLQSMANLFTLCHELAHIYGCQKKQFYNHCDKFMATELVLLTLITDKSLTQLLDLTTKHGFRVDIDFAEDLQDTIVNSGIPLAGLNE